MSKSTKKLKRALTNFQNRIFLSDWSHFVQMHILSYPKWKQYNCLFQNCHPCLTPDSAMLNVHTFLNAPLTPLYFGSETQEIK